MRLKIRRVSFIIAFVLMLSNLLGCSKNDWKPSGNLLLPMAKRNDTLGVYSIDLSNNLDIVKVFVDKQYAEINYPSVSEMGMLCVGYSESGIYSILNVDNGKAERLYQGYDKIFYPQCYDENSIVFVMKDEADNAYLYSCDLENNSLNKIYNGIVDIQSRPFLSSDGSILFVAENKKIGEDRKEKSSYTIMQIDGKKEVKQIIQGRFANWLNEGKQIIYDKGGSLYTYDIESSKSNRIKKGINFLCTPVFIGDNDTIAFIERDCIGGFSSGEVPYLTIMNISSSREIKTDLWSAVSKYNIYSIRNSEGFEWVE